MASVAASKLSFEVTVAACPTSNSLDVQYMLHYTSTNTSGTSSGVLYRPLSCLGTSLPVLLLFASVPCLTCNAAYL